MTLIIAAVPDHFDLGARAITPGAQGWAVPGRGHWLDREAELSSARSPPWLTVVGPG